MNEIQKLPKEILEKCNKFLEKFPKNQKRSAVIEILKIMQKEHGGYLTEQLIADVAIFLDIPKIFAYEVATFYSMFDLEKTGKNKIYLCMSISCMLCGSDKIYEHLKNNLQIDFNETSKDNKITLKKAECLAACGGAPAMLINEKYYENLTLEKIDFVIKTLE